MIDMIILVPSQQAPILMHDYEVVSGLEITSGLVERLVKLIDYSMHYQLIFIWLTINQSPDKESSLINWR